VTIPEILKDLEHIGGRFPRDAMAAAIQQQEAITPELLRVLEAVSEDPVGHAEREDYMLHIFAIFLLSQFREKRAYPLIVKMFSAPGETPFDLAGDTVTDGLDRILASVYDGNPASLRALVENEEVNEYVRTAAIDAFLVLERTGQMPRADVVEHFRSLFQGKLPRTDSFAWNGLVAAVADLPAPQLLEDVRQAYADGLVDSFIADLESIERNTLAPKPWRRETCALITDAIAEMESWDYSLREDPRPERPHKRRDSVPQPPPRPPAPSPETYVAPKPLVREPKVGRNDPCPCGSGKKYKKCCGNG
jgi:Protein of unknown function (DUF1186)/SEC-C motif